jgi:hypothetical protein
MRIKPILCIILLAITITAAQAASQIFIICQYVVGADGSHRDVKVAVCEDAATGQTTSCDALSHAEKKEAMRLTQQLRNSPKDAGKRQYAILLSDRTTHALLVK